MANDKKIPRSQTTESLDDISIEKLGRQRPSTFSSALAEISFCFSLLTSLAMAAYLISGFHTLLPALAFKLDIPPTCYTWPSSILTLVAGAFLLPIGRMSDMYGGYLVFNAGFIWFSIWCFIAGFSNHYVMLIACRAMQGLGAAAFLPAGIMLIGKIYRPGPRKNFIFSLYGAVSPIAFFIGIFVGGLAAERMSWRWYFWFGSAASFLGASVSLVAIPRDTRETVSRKVEMDWWGLGTIAPGIILLVFAITQSSMAPKGWATPYIYVAAILGLLFLAAAVYVEGWVSKAPFIPGEIFRAKNMSAMLFCLFVSYGVFGLFLFYANFYFELVLHISPLNTALYFSPWAIFGLILALTSGLLLHLLPGRLLLILSGLANLLALLLMALLPHRPNYYAHILPAMLAETACVDVLYTVTNVFITTHLPARHQGLAGALINCTLYLGVCFFLGVADVVVGRARAAGLGVEESYRIVFWGGVGCAGVVLGLFCFMDVGRAGSRLTVDEREGQRGEGDGGEGAGGEGEGEWEAREGRAGGEKKVEGV